ncbi:unnamed protein product [Gordionus sp. m RMFG-2023]
MAQSIKSRTDSNLCYKDCCNLFQEFKNTQPSLTSSQEKSLLLTTIGCDTYKILVNLCAPDSPGNKEVLEIHNILIKHFHSKPNIIVERYNFYQYNQQNDEKLIDYIQNLRKLATTCDFGEYLNTALRDKFIFGIKNPNILQRLLSEDDIDINKAIQIATAVETEPNDNINKIKKVNNDNDKQSKSYNNYNSSYKKPNPCHSCGGNHRRKNCLFKNATCYKYNKIGHIARVCRKEIVNFINNKTNEYNPEFWVDVKINNSDIRMELNTGDGVSIINEIDWKNKLNHPD